MHAVAQFSKINVISPQAVPSRDTQIIVFITNR